MASSVIGFPQRHIAAVDYAVNVLFTYFSLLPALVVPMPVGCPEHILVLFMLQQFTGLVEIGVTINWERVRNLIPESLRLHVTEQPDVLVGNPEFLKAYIDIEGEVSHPREIAIIVARGNNVVNVFHIMVNNKENNPRTYFCGYHVHGIPVNICTATASNLAVQRAENVLANAEITSIVVNGEDIAKLFPMYKDKIHDVEMPPWCIRPFHFSHHANRLLKNGDIVLPLRPQCPLHSHGMYKGPDKTPRTIGQRHKAIHGYHCALADAYELLLFVNSAERSRNVDILVKDLEERAARVILGAD